MPGIEKQYSLPNRATIPELYARNDTAESRIYHPAVALGGRN